MTNIGFIGLGNMGNPMAVNVQKNGFPMTVFDTNAKVIENLVQGGARAAKSAQEVVERVAVITQEEALAEFRKELDRNPFDVRPLAEVGEIHLRGAQSRDQPADRRGHERQCHREGQDRQIDVVRWWDDHQEALVTCEGSILLARSDNPIGRCPVVVVEMPRIGECVRGAYDDALGVQQARSLSQMYAIQAMKETVNAPLALPSDVLQLNLGEGAVNRSDTPEKIRRVDLPIPPGLFAQMQNIDNELRRLDTVIASTSEIKH